MPWRGSCRPERGNRCWKAATDLSKYIRPQVPLIPDALLPLRLVRWVDQKLARSLFPRGYDGGRPWSRVIIIFYRNPQDCDCGEMKRAKSIAVLLSPVTVHPPRTLLRVPAERCRTACDRRRNGSTSWQLVAACRSCYTPSSLSCGMRRPSKHTPWGTRRQCNPAARGLGLVDCRLPSPAIVDHLMASSRCVPTRNWLRSRESLCSIKQWPIFLDLRRQVDQV